MPVFHGDMSMAAEHVLCEGMQRVEDAGDPRQQPQVAPYRGEDGAKPGGAAGTGAACGRRGGAAGGPATPRSLPSESGLMLACMCAI